MGTVASHPLPSPRAAASTATKAVSRRASASTASASAAAAPHPPPAAIVPDADAPDLIPDDLFYVNFECTTPTRPRAGSGSAASSPGGSPPRFRAKHKEC